MAITKQIQRASLAQKCYQEMRRLILNGGFSPGQRLKEQDLAELLGVSRAPIRECIKELGRHGLVEVIPHKGATVTKLSKVYILDLMDVRMALECLVIRLACNNSSKKDLDYLQNSLDKVNELLLKTEEIGGYPSEYLDFHNYLVQVTDNNVLSSIMESIQDQLMLVRLFSGASSKRAIHALKEHKSILEALRMCDPQAAEERMRHHLHNARDNLLKKFSSMMEEKHSHKRIKEVIKGEKINFAT